MIDDSIIRMIKNNYRDQILYKRYIFFYIHEKTDDFFVGKQQVLKI